MYKSIIEQVCSDIQTQYENDMVKVVQSYGFNVDKEELAKALAYDRHQYEKGYEDGKREMLEKQNKYRWHDLREDPNDLPKDNDTRSEYMVTDGSQYFTSKYFGKGEYFNGCWEYPDGVFACNAYDVDVIAWREIEPFEVELKNLQF